MNMQQDWSKQCIQTGYVNKKQHDQTTIHELLYLTYAALKPAATKVMAAP